MTRGERVRPLGAAGVLGLAHLGLALRMVELRAAGGPGWGLLVLAGLLKLGLMIALLRELRGLHACLREDRLPGWPVIVLWVVPALTVLLLAAAQREVLAQWLGGRWIGAGASDRTTLIELVALAAILLVSARLFLARGWENDEASLFAWLALVVLGGLATWGLGLVRIPDRILHDGSLLAPLTLDLIFPFVTFHPETVLVAPVLAGLALGARLLRWWARGDVV